MTLPAPESTAKPVYTAPEPEEEEPAEAPDLSVFDQVADEPEEEPVSEPEPASAPEEPATEPEEEPEEEPAALPITAEEGAPAVFDEEWGGNEMADAVAAAEKKISDENKADIPLMNPDASNPFGGDLFTGDDNQDDMTGFDMDKPEEMVEHVAPLDVSDHAEASFDNDFTKDLLAQTMPSSSLENDADEDLLAAVKAAEEAAAIKPSSVSDISMDDEPEDSGMSEEDALMKALRDAEAALQSVSDSGNSGNDEAPQEEPAAEDPWADLQKQLEAMESANGADSAISYDEPEKQEEPAEEKTATPPSADDSSIWDFGGNSGSDNGDDDMSSDFGGFGGF